MEIIVNRSWCKSRSIIVICINLLRATFPSVNKKFPYQLSMRHFKFSAVNQTPISYLRHDSPWGEQWELECMKKPRNHSHMRTFGWTTKNKLRSRLFLLVLMFRLISLFASFTLHVARHSVPISFQFQGTWEFAAHRLDLNRRLCLLAASLSRRNFQRNWFTSPFFSRKFRVKMLICL